MRRRQNIELQDSTELLLDTICNTFGGILFISLLVVILVNTSGESSRIELVDDAATLELMELNNLREELVRDDLLVIQKELQDSLAQQAVYIGSLDRPSDLKAIEKLKKIEVEIASLQTQMVANEQRVTALELEKARLLQVYQELKNEIAQVRHETESSSKEVEAQLQKHSRQFVMKPAHARPGLVTETCFLVDGKLFGPIERWSGDAVIETTLFGAKTVRPNKSNGLSIKSEGTDTKLLEKRIGTAKSITIFVGLNSFAEWKKIESILQANNITYSLQITSNSPVLTFVDYDTGGLFQ